MNKTAQRGRPKGAKSTVLVQASRLKHLPDDLAIPISVAFAKTLFGEQPKEDFESVLESPKEENKPKVSVEVEEYTPED